jgi:hypothetical protein
MLYFRQLMKYLLGFLVILVVLDGLLTQGLVDGGLAREGNPLLQPLVGEAGFLVIKAVGVLLCAFILWDIYRRFPRVAVTATWCFVVTYGVIVLWNSSLFILA